MCLILKFCPYCNFYITAILGPSNLPITPPTTVIINIPENKSIFHHYINIDIAIVSPTQAEITIIKHITAKNL